MRRGRAVVSTRMRARSPWLGWAQWTCQAHPGTWLTPPAHPGTWLTPRSRTSLHATAARVA